MGPDRGSASSEASTRNIELPLGFEVKLDWPLHKLDVKNAFLLGDLSETIYMAQPLGFESKGECSQVDHFVFFEKTTHGIVILMVYVDDIVITGYIGSKPIATPMETNLKLMSEDVDVVSKFMTHPRVPHMKVVVRILKYLKNALGRGLLYKSSGHLCIEGYTDAD
ncbi:uncharacterized protein LOC131317311 [Rhododendron vialii]|uniref:uncharacterized protein LOC131317311 n=1 Tax=Rhododendron vialii TaxID=182163 RepID=UPI00265FA3B1|nr:uncharacterized protein LOC131317311 [Rhododendron vialii]